MSLSKLAQYLTQSHHGSCWSSDFFGWRHLHSNSWVFMATHGFDQWQNFGSFVVFYIFNSIQTKQIYWIFFEDFSTNSNTRNSLVFFLKIFQRIGTTTVCVCVCVSLSVTQKENSRQWSWLDIPYLSGRFLRHTRKLGTEETWDPPKRVEMESHRLKKVPAGKRIC